MPTYLGVSGLLTVWRVARMQEFRQYSNDGAVTWSVEYTWCEAKLSELIPRAGMRDLSRNSEDDAAIELFAYRLVWPRYDGATRGSMPRSTSV